MLWFGTTQYALMPLRVWNCLLRAVLCTTHSVRRCGAPAKDFCNGAFVQHLTQASNFKVETLPKVQLPQRTYDQSYAHHHYCQFMLHPFPSYPHPIIWLKGAATAFEDFLSRSLRFALSSRRCAAVVNAAARRLFSQPPAAAIPEWAALYLCGTVWH